MEVGMSNMFRLGFRWGDVSEGSGRGSPCLETKGVCGKEE